MVQVADLYSAPGPRFVLDGSVDAVSGRAKSSARAMYAPTPDTPVVGAGRVVHVLGRIAAAASLQPAQVNGYPALILRLNGEIDTVMAVRIDDGLITGLYAVRNPEKLSHMERETALRRWVRGPSE